ncbi:MAG: ORF6N domain-containing protein, partial [Terrimicrobiaceae bacterium]|nr:ORF6N domain-containing protein [Terrimicrobiaceae bacterium]
MNAPLDSLILTIRGQKVILDADLAGIYGVPSKALNQAVKRNIGRFPEDFCFQLTRTEAASSRSQIVTLDAKLPADECNADSRSQIATLKTGRGQNIKYLPYAFTEHGALMAANILNSPEAAKMSVYVVRAFIKQRELLMAQSDVLKKLAQMDAKLLEHDDALRVIWQELQPLLNPPPVPPKPQIGFHAKEDSPA